jgi:hypothetical protein
MGSVSVLKSAVIRFATAPSDGDELVGIVEEREATQKGELDMRTSILIVLSGFALIVVFNGIFVTSCTDRIATSPWCMPHLAMVVDLLLIGATIGFVIYRRRWRR